MAFAGIRVSMYYVEYPTWIERCRMALGESSAELERIVNEGLRARLVWA